MATARGFLFMVLLRAYTSPWRSPPTVQQTPLTDPQTPPINDHCWPGICNYVHTSIDINSWKALKMLCSHANRWGVTGSEPPPKKLTWPWVTSGLMGRGGVIIYENHELRER